MRAIWPRLVGLVDEFNHRTLLRRRVTNRLCNYNERLITGDHGTDFYEDDEPIEDIRVAWEAGERGFTLSPTLTGTVWCSHPGLLTGVSPSTLTIIQPPS